MRRLEGLLCLFWFDSFSGLASGSRPGCWTLLLVTGLTAGMFVRFVTAFTVILWRRIVSVAHKKHTLSMRCQQFYVTVQKFVRLSPELRTHDSSGGRRRQMCR